MKFSRILLIVFGALFLNSNLHAQNFDNLQFGTDYTLDVITWNTEWFPANGQTTVNYVTEIIESLDAEIIAFQEIDKKARFQDLIDNLDDYEGYYISNDSYQGLAYLYHKDRVQILDQYEIFTNDWSEFPRSPLVMKFQFENKNYTIINNHLKCCGDGSLNTSDFDDEENRRYRACNKLNTYIEYYLDSDRVILLGDLNDELTDSEQNNVFRNLINDNSHYFFADMSIAEGNNSFWSYPSWPSHLDHIMISNELFSTFNEPASTCAVIKIDEYFSSWNAYENNVSDHRPVGLKLQTKEIGLVEIAENNNPIFPNPFNESFEIKVNNNSDYFRIFNSSGKLILKSTLKNDPMIISSAKWPSGLYLIQFIDAGKVVKSHKILKS